MNPKLFQSAEFYHRRYHNFATLLVLPMTIFLNFFNIVLFNRKKRNHRDLCWQSSSYKNHRRRTVDK